MLEHAIKWLPAGDKWWAAASMSSSVDDALIAACQVGQGGGSRLVQSHLSCRAVCCVLVYYNTCTWCSSTHVSRTKAHALHPYVLHPYVLHP
jgi:hypothetical protein